MTKRRSIPKVVETRLLQACRRRCCLCVFLDDDHGVSRGQIAHIDGNPSNAAYGNLAWLCLRHHDEYDSRTSQSKGITEEELTSWRDRLHAQYEQVDPDASGESVKGARVRASAIRRGPRLCAQIRVENTDMRPLRIACWICEMRTELGEQYRESVHDSLPIVLAERQEHVFLAHLGQVRADTITAIGVKDSDRRVWMAPECDVASFAALAADEERLAHLMPSPTEALIPKDESLAIQFEARPEGSGRHLCFVARVTNTGAEPVPILGARLDWRFVAARAEPSAGILRARKLGSAIDLPSPLKGAALLPSETVEFVIERGFARVLVEAAASDVDRHALAFSVVVSPKHCWRCTEDGLPETVEQVARSILAAAHSGS